MNVLKHVRTGLNHVVAENKIREWYGLHKKNYMDCDMVELHKKLNNNKLWGLTLGFNYLLLIAAFITMIYIPQSIPILIFILDGMGVLVFLILICENNQEKNSIQLFIKNKEREDVDRRILELLIENNINKEEKELENQYEK